MKKTLFALILFLITAGSFYYYQQYVYHSKPIKVRELDRQIQQENEKLIAAQIIANELKQVTRLIRPAISRW
jgi:cell division protein FtsL